MTANVKLVVAEKPSVLKIPNAALRFRPAGTDTEAGAAAPPAQARGGGADSGSGPLRTSPEQIRERLVKGLGLSEEQQRKLDPILEQTRQEMMGLRGEPLADAERQTRIQKVRDASRARIREILTPEQQRRYDELSPPSVDRRAASQPGRVWVLGPDGKPKPVSLMLGISDGTATEVVRGELADGQEILVGQAGQQAPRPPTGGSSGGPRLRL
jgi:HlyD family secretion protein